MTTSWFFFADIPTCTETISQCSPGILDIPHKHTVISHTAGSVNIISATSKKTENGKQRKPSEIDDLIHLPGPLTEDAVMRALQARFNENKYFVSR